MGRFDPHGSKNAALPILAASLLARSPSTIYGVPKLRDVYVMLEILEYLGAKISLSDDVALRGLVVNVDPSPINRYEIPAHLMAKMRSSIFLMGPLLSRIHTVSLSQPGGCNIGERPIDIHLDGLRSLGAHTVEEDGYIHIETNRLKAAEYHLHYPSVGATENLLMAAVLAEGKSILHNVAKEPEVTDLVRYLNHMGAKVSGAGTGKLMIEGVASLQGARHKVILDRIEVGTYMVAAVMTRGVLELPYEVVELLPGFMQALSSIGVRLHKEGYRLILEAAATHTGLSIKTGPFPEFPTDLQPLWATLATTAVGRSEIVETVFENRYRYASSLATMGADIERGPHGLVLHGVAHLVGKRVKAVDLRSGAALVCAGLAARGESIVTDIYHIERGYQDLALNLRELGAKIERVDDD